LVMLNGDVQTIGHVLEFIRIRRCRRNERAACRV
jgi:hypothetical protein